MGYDVEVIASLLTFDTEGKFTYLKEPIQYTSENGFLVQRLSYIKPTKLGKLLRKYRGTYDSICNAKPDVIFIHGVQFADISIVIKYLRDNPNVKVYVDNHSDFSNSATNWLSLHIQHKILWRYFAWLINPYTAKFYGVLPARVDFLIDVYKIPKEKVELLMMGADDELVIKAANPDVKKGLRLRYDIALDDFLIITGGKIDFAKKQILLLMKAVQQIQDNHVKLIVFGSVVDELKEEIARLSDRVKIQYIGWVDARESYDFFASSDLVIFPGRHSVFWEQVAGQGLPMIVKYWEGTTHIDCGGNVIFLNKDSVEVIKEKIEEAIKNYSNMKKIAATSAEQFNYSKIAEKSIQ
jgi:glycosyltransferase involved in cell wall biosynthesis